MKTTLEIDDHLYREAKAFAALTGRKMKDLVSEGLRRVLGAAESGDRPSPEMKLPLVPSGKGERIASERIYDLETSADLDRL